MPQKDQIKSRIFTLKKLKVKSNRLSKTVADEGNWEHCIALYTTLYVVGRVYSLNLPLIEGQVPVSELREQSPLQDLLGRLVLDEVDDDVLESVVVLGRRVLLGKSQKTSVLQLYGLTRETRGGEVKSWLKTLTEAEVVWTWIIIIIHWVQELKATHKGLQFNYSIAFVILQTAQIILSSEFYADNLFTMLNVSIRLKLWNIFRREHIHSLSKSNYINNLTRLLLR